MSGAWFVAMLAFQGWRGLARESVGGVGFEVGSSQVPVCLVCVPAPVPPPRAVHVHVH